ncbi:MAG: ATP-dependent helicase, partial [Microbacteriaceae bacterium]|nr:ATP-dependent helicase [Microbacteriaceae bacterium]
PTETYSSSPHLFTDLDIPEGTKGRLPGTHSTKVVAPPAGRDGGGRGGRDGGRGGQSRQGGQSREGGQSRPSTSQSADGSTEPRAEGSRPPRSRNRTRTRTRRPGTPPAA